MCNAGGKHIYKHINRKIVPVVRLGWLAGTITHALTHFIHSTQTIQLQVIDISNYVKNLVLIIEHSTARNKRLTAAKLVGAWRETRQTGFSRPASVPATDKTIEVCERIIVRALLEGNDPLNCSGTPLIRTP